MNIQNNNNNNNNNGIINPIRMISPLTSNSLPFLHGNPLKTLSNSSNQSDMSLISVRSLNYLPKPNNVISPLKVYSNPTISLFRNNNNRCNIHHNTRNIQNNRNNNNSNNSTTINNNNNNNIKDNDDIKVNDSDNNNTKSHTVIVCSTCCRTFYTQAQFGQHSRICKGGKSVSRQQISECYSYLEKQTRDKKLEIKCRFIISMPNPSEWKSISRVHSLHDSGIKLLLKSNNINSIDVAIRQRKESQLIIANFMYRDVEQNSNAINHAKETIKKAVEIVKEKLPPNFRLKLHLCSVKNCRELVIRDTEGFCSRHRAQKYHGKHKRKKTKKRAILKAKSANHVTRNDENEAILSLLKFKTIKQERNRQINQNGIHNNHNNIDSSMNIDNKKRVFNSINEPNVDDSDDDDDIQDINDLKKAGLLTFGTSNNNNNNSNNINNNINSNNPLPKKKRKLENNIQTQSNPNVFISNINSINNNNNNKLNGNNLHSCSLPMYSSTFQNISTPLQMFNNIPQYQPFNCISLNGVMCFVPTPISTPIQTRLQPTLQPTIQTGIQPNVFTLQPQTLNNHFP